MIILIMKNITNNNMYIVQKHKRSQELHIFSQPFRFKL